MSVVRGVWLGGLVWLGCLFTGYAVLWLLEWRRERAFIRHTAQALALTETPVEDRPDWGKQE